MFRDDDRPLRELWEGGDADELCRCLLRSSFGPRSSTRHMEAVELLRSVHGTGELGDQFLVLLLCTCRRWDRVTAKLIAAIEDTGLLSDHDLDGLAESFLADEAVIEYHLTWVSPEWLAVDLEDGAARTMVIDEDTLTRTRLRPEPPLRRWAAARALRADPARLEELVAAAHRFAPHHRDAVIHGLVDACDSVDADTARRVVRRGLRARQGRVRRAALERLCELDGPDAARRRARSDADATVRAWRPPQQSDVLFA